MTDLLFPSVRYFLVIRPRLSLQIGEIACNKKIKSCSSQFVTRQLKLQRSFCSNYPWILLRPVVGHLRDDSAFILTNCFIFSYKIVTKSRLTSWGASIRWHRERSERVNERCCAFLYVRLLPTVGYDNVTFFRFALIRPRNTFYSCITRYIAAETYNSRLLCLVHDSRLPTGRSRILSHCVERVGEISLTLGSPCLPRETE